MDVTSIIIVIIAVVAIIMIIILTMNVGMENALQRRQRSLAIERSVDRSRRNVTV